MRAKSVVSDARGVQQAYELIKPVELLIIGGGAVGAFLVGNSGKAIKATMQALPSLLKGSKYNRALYMELMALLYELLPRCARKA
jgi:chemotaxis protein MotA